MLEEATFSFEWLVSTFHWTARLVEWRVNNRMKNRNLKAQATVGLMVSTVATPLSIVSSVMCSNLTWYNTLRNPQAVVLSVGAFCVRFVYVVKDSCDIRYD